MRAARQLLILAGLFVICTGGLFISCKNFLDAGKTSQEIKDSLAYNNAKDVTVNMFCKAEMGTVYPQTSFKCKLGYEFELQFFLNNDYYVIKNPATVFEAVNKNNTSEKLSDLVQFTALEQTSEEAKTGLYRVKAKILDDSKEILIQPCCLLRPSVETSRWTYNTEGVYANTPIVVNFDMPMQNDDGTKLTLTYDNNTIMLKDKSRDVSRLFEQPVLNDEGTQLTITPKPNDLLAYIDDLPFIDIYISFGQNTKITKEGAVLPLIQQNQSLFNMRYKADLEKDPPKEYAFFATRNPVNLSNALALEAQDKFLIKQLNNFATANEILQNRNNGTFYIYGQYYDSGSGVETVIIQENQTNTSEGLEIETKEITHYYTAASKEAEFFTDEIGNTFFCIKFVSEYLNGAIQLKVFVKDLCNNSTEPKTFTVFKKSYDDSIFENIKLTNAEGLKEIYATEKEFNQEQAYELLKEITFSNNRDENSYDVSLFDFYNANGKITLLDNSVSIECVYKNKDDQIVRKPFTQVIKNDAQAYTTKIILDDIAKISGMQFTIVASDDLGNLAQKTFNVPESEKVECCLTYSSFELFYTDYDASYNKDGPHIFIKKKDDSSLIANTIDLQTSHVLNKNDEFCILPKIGDFFIEIPSYSIVVENYSSNSCTPVNISEWSLERSDKPGFLDFTVTIEDNQGFDSVFIEDWTEATLNGFEDGSVNYYFFQEGNNSLTVQIDSKILYQAWYNYFETDNQEYIYFFVAGIKNHQKSEQSSQIPIIWDNSKYDNIQPEYSFARKDYYNFVFSITDYSNLTSVSVKNKKINKTYDTIKNSDSNYSVIIPIYDLASKDNNFVIEAKDEYNNALCEEVLFDVVDTGISFEKPEFDSLLEAWSLTTKEFESSLDEDEVQINAYYYDNKWESIDHANWFVMPLEDENGDSINAFGFYLDVESIESSPCYIKVIANYDGEYADTPFLFYPYEDEYSSVNDLIIENGNSRDSVAISSRAPVFVQTFSTTESYEECNNWSVDEWEKFNEPFGIKIMEFSSLDHSPQRYDIDILKIKSGECYCVIAHFANGTAVMSKIMQK